MRFKPEPEAARGRQTRRRRGYSLLEAQAAFAVLSIAISGVGPFVVYQLRQMKMLEARYKAGVTYYVVPSVKPWARKLGASAARLSTDPGAWTSEGSTPVNNITILSVDTSASSEDATVHTQLN